MFNKLCSKYAANLSLDTKQSFCKSISNSFRVVAGERWHEGKILPLKNPLEKNTVSCPQTVIFEGSSAKEVQEKANAFLVKNPHIEIIDTELSTNLETTSVEYYYKATYAIVYKQKEA